MTEEELAEEWAEKNISLATSMYNPQAESIAKRAFLAGLKAQTKWHKVSEQLPTEEKDYLVKLTDGTIDVMAIALDGNLEPYLLTPKFDFYKDVEKWCEIPKE